MPRLALFLLTCALPLLVVAGEQRPPRGVLIYPDGNRITGVLVAPHTFASDRFGTVRFEDQDARFQADAHDAAALETIAPPPPTTAIAQEVRDTTATPPPAEKRWKFQVDGFLETRHEGSDRSVEYNLEFKASHRWTEDLVTLESRLEYKEKNSKLDRRRYVLKGNWEHDLTPRWYALYRPYLEYDGFDLLPNWRLNYLLNQEQAGLGLRYLNSPRLHGRVGMTWSYFHLHAFHLGNAHADSPGWLVEHDLQLPWQLEFTQRGELYYEFKSDSEALGIASELSLTKHFGEHFYFTLRHEYRRDYPIDRANYIKKLRWLFGYSY